MDIEEFKAALDTDEGKKLVGAIIEKEVEGLKNKNTELLGLVKKEKETKSDLEKRLEAIEEEKEEAEQKAVEKSGDVEKIKQRLEERHAKEIEKLTGANKDLNNRLHKHVVGEGLTAALVKANVQPALMDAAKALIRTGYEAEVGDNDGTPFAKIGGKPVEDFVTEWAQSDSGKHFVSASGNSGGGSNGANDKAEGSGGTKEMARSEFDKLSPYEKSEFSTSGGRLTNE